MKKFHAVVKKKGKRERERERKREKEREREKNPIHMQLNQQPNHVKRSRNPPAPYPQPDATQLLSSLSVIYSH